MVIFSFSNYQDFLRAYKQSLPKKGWGFVSKLADAIGISQAQMSQIFSGEKELNLDQVPAVAEFLKLNEAETEYLIWLVIKSRAGNHKLSKIVAGKTAALKEKGLQVRSQVPPARELTEEQRTRFYSSYLYSAIRHFVNIGNGKTLDEIGEKFGLDRPKALSITEFLVGAGLLSMVGDRYRLGAQRTLVARGSPHLNRHHANWRLKTMNDCDDIGPGEMVYTSPMSISRKDFEIVYGQLLALVKDVSERVRDTEPEMIVCWNMDWFEVKK